MQFERKTHLKIMPFHESQTHDKVIMQMPYNNLEEYYIDMGSIGEAPLFTEKHLKVTFEPKHY